MAFIEMDFFLESVLRFCFHITSLMLSRLYSIREDYLNVSNVDLYYINNSQVYVGLFLFLKFTFDTVKNLSFRKIKNNTVLTKIKCGVCFLRLSFWFGFHDNVLVRPATPAPDFQMFGRSASMRFDPSSAPYSTKASCVV